MRRYLPVCLVVCFAVVVGTSGCARFSGLDSQKSMGDGSAQAEHARAGSQTRRSARDHAGKDNSRSYGMQLSEARNYERAGEWDKAREVYESLLAKHPDQMEPYHRLGVVADHQRRHSEAQQLFTQAIRLEPRNAELFNDLGYCFFLQGQLNKAESALYKATQLAPSNPRFRNNLGMVVGHQGRFEEAFEQFSLAGSEADAYYNLAFIYATRNDDAKAEECFLNALAADPTHAKARSALQSFEHAKSDEDSTDALVSDGQEVRYVPYSDDPGSDGTSAAPATAEMPVTNRPGVAVRALHHRTRGLLNRNLSSNRSEDPVQP